MTQFLLKSDDCRRRNVTERSADAVPVDIKRMKAAGRQAKAPKNDASSIDAWRCDRMLLFLAQRIVGGDPQEAHCRFQIWVEPSPAQKANIPGDETERYNRGGGRSPSLIYLAHPGVYLRFGRHGVSTTRFTQKSPVSIDQLRPRRCCARSVPATCQFTTVHSEYPWFLVNGPLDQETCCFLLFGDYASM
jgi:hypothetical protein